MASQILLPKNVDFTKFSFGAPKVTNSGSRIVPISYDEKQLIFQTARMTCNYGLSKWGGDGNNTTPKYSLDGSFKGKDTNKSLGNFYEFLQKLDKFMIEKGVENSVEWFKKKHNNVDVVEALYSHALRFPKDKETGEVTDKYPPSFKLSLPFKDGVCQCKVYDDKQNPMELAEAMGMQLKGATISAIVKCTGLWLAGGNFGVTMRVEQLRVEMPSNSLETFAFQDDDDTVCVADDDDDCEVIPEPRKNVDTHIDTSDEEDEPPTEEAAPVPVKEEAPEEAPVAKGKPAAKKIVKK